MDGFVRYQQGRSFSAATIKRRQAALRSLQRWIGDRPILTAAPADVEEWLASLRTAATKAHYRSDVGVFFRWAQRRGLVERNPVDLTDPVRRPRGVPRPVPIEAITAAAGVADRSTRLAILLGAYAGLRISEMAALDRADVTTDGPCPAIFVRHGKGAKSRVVPLHPILAAIIRPMPAGPLLPVSVPTLRRRISAAFAAVGVTMTPHQLRHATGTELARVSNGNMLLVAHVLGHDDISTTQVYTRFSVGPEAAAVARMWADTA